MPFNASRRGGERGGDATASAKLHAFLALPDDAHTESPDETRTVPVARLRTCQGVAARGTRLVLCKVRCARPEWVGA
jgi:hypothetical protein